ncbi:MAG: hypothetical protein ONA90_08285, partial [candidate division KSB1 bacterium]|nr:hypothetical protein [candidate division KSB1 bacterium]
MVDVKNSKHTLGAAWLLAMLFSWETAFAQPEIKTDLAMRVTISPRTAIVDSFGTWNVAFILQADR